VNALQDALEWLMRIYYSMAVRALTVVKSGFTTVVCEATACAGILSIQGVVPDAGCEVNVQAARSRTFQTKPMLQGTLRDDFYA
jgi:hypothetical protein